MYHLDVGEFFIAVFNVHTYKHCSTLAPMYFCMLIIETIHRESPPDGGKYNKS